MYIYIEKEIYIYIYKNICIYIYIYIFNELSPCQAIQHRDHCCAAPRHAVFSIGRHLGSGGLRFGKNCKKIKYFSRITTYSNRKFDIIDPSKWII